MNRKREKQIVGRQPFAAVLSAWGCRPTTGKTAKPGGWPGLTQRRNAQRGMRRIVGRQPFAAVLSAWGCRPTAGKTAKPGGWPGPVRSAAGPAPRFRDGALRALPCPALLGLTHS
ncbi:MAG: hypothetical protein NTX45_03245 [Proteobacteria bacterium]|nr:hypothetical protein [Pseudomonadota bacterium]